jgi:ribosomal protein S14
MICPECNQSFDGGERLCPRCGMMKGVVKTSTILISRGETRQVYRSVEEVPDGLKRQLFRSTNGLNSADRYSNSRMASSSR